MALTVLILGIILSVSQAHKADIGGCPTIPPVDDFNLQRFLGTWNVLYKVKTGTACLKNLYYEDESSGDLKVTEEKYMDTKIGEAVTNLTSEVKLTAIPGIMQIKYHTAVPNSSLRVLATDYNNYALIFKCQPFIFFHRWSVSILARDPNYANQKMIASLFELMESNDLDSSLLDKIDHNGCGNFDNVDLSVNFEGDDFNLDVDGTYVDNVKDTLDKVGEVIKDAANMAAKEVLHRTSDLKENEVVDDGLL